MASKLTRALAALSMVLLFAVAASADCRKFFSARHAVVAQAVVAQPVVLYQAGYQIEQAANEERIARRVVEMLRAELRHGQAGQPGAQAVEQAAAQTAMGQHCAKCHSGAKPKAELVFDGATAVSCSQVTRALRAVAADKMPKDHRLTPDQKGAIMQELLDLELEQQPEALPPVQEPPK